MSPYIDLKPVTCIACDKPARVKIVTIRHGLYFAYCVEHLFEFATNLEAVPP